VSQDVRHASLDLQILTYR
jgi:hypothetical protein